MVAVLILGLILAGVGSWFIFLAVVAFRVADRMSEPYVNSIALVFVAIAFMSLIVAIILFISALNKSRSKKKNDING